jgi:hypothetical protein
MNHQPRKENHMNTIPSRKSEKSQLAKVGWPRLYEPYPADPVYATRTSQG